MKWIETGKGKWSSGPCGRFDILKCDKGGEYYFVAFDWDRGKKAKVAFLTTAKEWCEMQSKMTATELICRARRA